MPHLIAVLLACIIALALLVSSTTASEKVGCEIGAVGTGLGTIMKERPRTSVSDTSEDSQDTSISRSISIMKKIEAEDLFGDWSTKVILETTKDLSEPCSIS